MICLVKTNNRSARPGLRFVGELTTRETEVLKCAARGLTCVETGKELFVGSQTVKYHRASLLSKLLARNITQAVSIGYERGILQAKDLPTEVVIDGVLFQPVTLDK